MKNVTILLFFIALTGNAFAQERRIDEKKIPQTVISYLRQNYSTAKRIEYYQKYAL